jgi:hypothetical protein
MKLFDLLTKPHEEVGVPQDFQAFFRYAWAKKGQEQGTLDQTMEEFNETFQKSFSKNEWFHYVEMLTTEQE